MKINIKVSSGYEAAKEALKYKEGQWISENIWESVDYEYDAPYDEAIDDIMETLDGGEVDYYFKGSDGHYITDGHYINGEQVSQEYIDNL